MRYLVMIPIFFFVSLQGNSQNPRRFKNEIANIQKKYDTLWDASKETLVFAGSSSIRTWTRLEEIFPAHQIINSGFGGSQASDLLAYSDELILNFNPSKVFIYAGDNDLAAGKKPKGILATILEIKNRIRAKKSDVGIVLIAAKPSMARWSLKRKYKHLNRKFEKLCNKDNLMHFANIWDPMLLGKNLNPNIYLEDGLHMNAEGYKIWNSVLQPFIDH